VVPERERIGPFQILLLGLSLYVLVALFIEKIFVLPPDIVQIFDVADTVICAFFLADFFIRFYRAESKWMFMRWGWVDLISSIPTFDWLRWGRLVRVARVLRVLRGLRSIRIIFQLLFAKRAHGAFATVLFVCAVLVPVAAVAILHVETAPESNIKDATDAVWWATATITTVGYGDKFPVTAEGRAIAAALMVVGIGAFGSFTALAATWLSGGHEESNAQHHELLNEIRALREEVAAMRSSAKGVGSAR
jgi:voltage-gated potassium channel